MDRGGFVGEFVRSVFFVCGVLALGLLTYSDCSALDPRFELNTAELGAQRHTTEPREPAAKKEPVARKKQLQKPGLTRKTAAVRRQSRFSPAPHRVLHRTVRRTKTSRVTAPVPSVHMRAAVPSGIAGLAQTQEVWSRLFPGKSSVSPRAAVRGENFSLSLDPERYPVFPAADGGTVIIDADKSLSPLITSVLQGQDPRLRIISAVPDGSFSFFSQLLNAAGFYSVEDSFVVRLGSDPQVTARADFRVERNRDSVLEDDIVLLNTGDQRTAMPPELRSALVKDGFAVVEVAPFTPMVPDGSKTLQSITTNDQRTMVDELAAALALPGEKDRDLILDDGVRSGVRLTVRAHRYFVRDGARTVVSFAENNPVQYTLLRLLQLQGYRVVMVARSDSFAVTCEKVLTALGIPAVQGMQSLNTAGDIPFSVNLSGVAIHNGKDRGSRTILTDRTIDPLARSVATALGFVVVPR